MNSITQKTQKTKNPDTWLMVLLSLTAISLMPVYWVQGILIHSAPSEVPGVFWYIEAAAWAFRAIIEVMVIFFLFKTPAEGKQAKAIFGFEVALIILLWFTMGMGFYAIGENDKIAGNWIATLWRFALGGYAPLMIAACGVAYKAQLKAQREAQIAEAAQRPKPVQLRPKTAAPIAKPETVRREPTSGAMTVNERREKVLQLKNDEGMSNAEIANTLQIKQYTVSRDLQVMNGAVTR